VRLDGELLYSKHDTGRFPSPDEVLESMEPRLSA